MQASSKTFTRLVHFKQSLNLLGINLFGCVRTIMYFHSSNANIDVCEKQHRHVIITCVPLVLICIIIIPVHKFIRHAHILPFLGRIDRKIEFPLPDEKTKRKIFQIHTSKMTLADDVDLEEYIMAKDDLSGADIKVSY